MRQALDNSVILLFFFFSDFIDIAGQAALDASSLFLVDDTAFAQA